MKKLPILPYPIAPQFGWHLEPRSSIAYHQPHPCALSAHSLCCLATATSGFPAPQLPREYSILAAGPGVLNFRAQGGVACTVHTCSHSPDLCAASLTLLSLSLLSLQFPLLGFLSEAHGCRGPPGVLTPCFLPSVMSACTAQGAQARTAPWQAHPGLCMSRCHSR